MSTERPRPWIDPSPATHLEPIVLGQFDTFQDWVNHASRALSGHVDSNGHELKVICVDNIGRRCANGRDFARARDEDTFPVRYFTDMQITSATPYWKSLAVRYRRLIEKFVSTTNNISDHIEDEGDRVYFGSTNHANDLREICQAFEETRWDRVINNEDKDPYEIIRELRLQLDLERRSNQALRFKVVSLKALSKSRLFRLKKVKAKLHEVQEAFDLFRNDHG